MRWGGGVIDYLPDDYFPEGTFSSELMTESGEGVWNKIKKMIENLIEKIKKFFSEIQRKRLKRSQKVEVPKTLYSNSKKTLKTIIKVVRSFILGSITLALLSKFAKSLVDFMEAYHRYKNKKDRVTEKVERQWLETEIETSESMIQKLQQELDKMQSSGSSTPEK